MLFGDSGFEDRPRRSVPSLAASPMSTSGNGENPTIRIPDPVGVKELAAALHQKPFKIIADTIAQGTFQNIHGHLSFDMAAKIAHKYGYSAQKIS
jgi:hypothetical protein